MLINIWIFLYEIKHCHIISRNPVPRGIEAPGSQLEGAFVRAKQANLFNPRQILGKFPAKVSNFVCSLCCIWSVIKEKKEDCPPEEMNDDHPLSGASNLFD